MNDPLVISSLEEWVLFVFDHPASDPRWYWDFDAPWWNEEDHFPEVIAYLTSLFTDSKKHLEPYSNAQINQGLWYMVHNSSSNHMYALFDENIPLKHRLLCIKEIENFFWDCFAERCSANLSHCDDSLEIDILNSACYMFFDLLPYIGKPNDPKSQQVDQAFLNVLEHVIYIPHTACCESGLHGLGHWALNYPQQAKEIINKFLKAFPNLNPILVNYAKQAAIACVQ